MTGDQLPSNKKRNDVEGKPVKKGPSGKRSTIEHELQIRLRWLRSMARTISRVYLSNLEHDIVDAIELMSEKKRSGQIQTSDLRKALSLIESLKLKPEKGRKKDLKKIEQAVHLIVEQMQKNS